MGKVRDDALCEPKVKRGKGGELDSVRIECNWKNRYAKSEADAKGHTVYRFER